VLRFDQSAGAHSGIQVYWCTIASSFSENYQKTEFGLQRGSAISGKT